MVGSHKLITYALCCVCVCSIWACEKDDSGVDSIVTRREPVVIDFHGESVVVAQWNIGHFAGGADKRSHIDSDTYQSKLQEFRSLISSTGSDILSVNEFSTIFGTELNGNQQLTRDALFFDYSVCVEGHQSNYSCNALFSKIELSKITESVFECNQTARITHTTAIQAKDYYYIEATLILNGIPTKLVTAHLAFDKNDENVARNQIHEIIDKYYDDAYVIICGDWNIKDVNTFDLFTSAGYQIANHGKFGDFATYGKSVLDNIIVKGFTIKGVRTIDTNLSDHRPLIATIDLNRN